MHDNIDGMTDPIPAASASETGVLLEKDKRFSDSVLWELQRGYYARQGPNAWHSGEVPSYATCNTYIAQTYACSVIAYLRDARAAGQIDPAQPIYIVELAAGVGRFAYQFLNKFRQLKRESSLRDLDVRYVMTDFTSTNLNVWKNHPHLAPFVADRVLDFGAFDVDSDREIALVSGGKLSPETVNNPLVVLANYAFDTFRHDLFRITNGALHEIQVATRSPETPPDLNRSDAISKLRVQYSDRLIAKGYYDDPILDRVLGYYQARLGEVAFTIPYGGMRGLRSLTAIAKGRLLLISSDKGFTHEDELYQPHQLNMQFHTGCFSMMVNYHAIGQYFIEQGGHYVASARRAMNLRTVACLLGGDELQFADTLSMLRERILYFGPGEFFDLLQQQRQDKRPITVEHFLGLLRMSNFDPGVVWDYSPQLRTLAMNLDDAGQLELRLAIDRAWQNYFPGPQNLPFELARILMAMRRPIEAIRYNQISLDWFGDDSATRHNMGICQYYAENITEALRCFKRSLELDPTFVRAREWLVRIYAELAQGVTPVPYVPNHVAAEPGLGDASGPVRAAAPLAMGGTPSAGNGKSSSPA